MPIKYLSVLLISILLLACEQNSPTPTATKPAIEPSATPTQAISIVAAADRLKLKDNRYYDQQQVISGQQVFRQHCQACHGDQAQGQKNWQQANPDGSFPAPPLNGTAHTWHHSQKILLRTINDGGKALGGQMPSFKDVLSDVQKRAVLSYIQNLWPDEIYQAWMENNRG